MIGLQVRGTEAVAGRLRVARTGVLAAQERGVRAATVLVERALKAELSQKGAMDAFWGKRGAPGDGLAVRSGRTRASITGGGVVRRVGERVVGAVGSRDRHLVDHEGGATVHGTSPKGYLRIPTAASLTGAGVDRNAGRSIRGLPGVFLLTSKAGRLWAATNSGKRLVLLYLLVKSVVLRPRRIFARVRREQEAHTTEALRVEIAQVVQRANA